jgi:hypothetical protein
MLTRAKPLPTLEELERASWLPPDLVAERDRLRGLADSWEYAQREMAERAQAAAEARHREELSRRRYLPAEPASEADACVFGTRAISGVFAEIDGTEWCYSGQTVTCIPPELLAQWRRANPQRGLRSVSLATLESLPEAVARTWPTNEITNFDGVVVRPKLVQIACDVVANTSSVHWLTRWFHSAQRESDSELESVIKRRFTELGIYSKPDEAA